MAAEFNNQFNTLGFNYLTFNINKGVHLFFEILVRSTSRPSW